MLCDILLRKNNESKSIPRTIDRIFNEPFGNDKKIKENIQSILNKLKSDLDTVNQDIENLGKFRNNVYAHFNNNLFSEQWQEEFKLKYPFDYEKILVICKRCIEYFSEILGLLGEEPYLKAIIQFSSTKFLIDTLSK